MERSCTLCVASSPPPRLQALAFNEHMKVRCMLQENTTQPLHQVEARKLSNDAFECSVVCLCLFYVCARMSVRVSVRVCFCSYMLVCLSVCVRACGPSQVPPAGQQVAAMRLLPVVLLDNCRLLCSDPSAAHTI